MRFLKNITMVLLLMLPLLFLFNTEVVPVAARLAGRESTSLTYVREQDSITLDPALVQDEESCKVITNIYEEVGSFQSGYHGS